MLRLTSNLSKLSINPEPLTTNLQTVRWRRKPRWLPVAKSKMFRVPERPVVPEDEAKELKRLSNNYNNNMNSIKKYLVAKYNKEKILDDSEHRREVADADFKRCLKLNEEWNAKVRVERESFFEGHLKKSVELAKERMETQKVRKIVRLEEAESLIRKQKELSKSFITPENVDAAIQHALANEVDYNYAIDLEGNKYHGRNTAPTNKNDKGQEKIAVKQ